jgi:hypothetical protein
MKKPIILLLLGCLILLAGFLVLGMAQEESRRKIQITDPESDQPLLTAELPLHLEEHLDAARIVGSEVPEDVPSVVEWRFDEPQPEWRPAKPLVQLRTAAVEAVRVDDALRLPLTAERRGTSRLFGIIYVDLPDWNLENWSYVEIRARTRDPMRVVGLIFNYTEEVPHRSYAPFYAWGDRTPLVTDGTVQTYRLSLDWLRMRKWEGPWTHLGIWFNSRPGEEAVTLDILSVRVIPKEHIYADAPVGVREEKRNEAQRRTLYTHAPGRIEYHVRVPHAGRLDVGLGVLKEDFPVTFRIVAFQTDKEERTLFEETYANQGEWGQRIIDLSSFAGKTVKVALEADAKQPGTVAFWAAPTISGIRDEYKPKIYAGQQEESLDLDAVRRIKEEAFERSQVMDLVGILSDVYGPRLRGSFNFLKAGEWAAQTLTEWGLKNARLEPWVPFDRGWTNERFYAHVISPVAYPLIGYPLAWTPGTDGWVTGEAKIVRISNAEDLERYRGTLRGKFVLTEPPPSKLRPMFEMPRLDRYSDEKLKQMSEEGWLMLEHREGWQNWNEADIGRAVLPLRKFFIDEGVAAWIGYGYGYGGKVDVECCWPRAPELPPLVFLVVQHYGRIWRNLERGIPVTLEMNIQNSFYEEDANSFNVLAEIPGSDKADEVVIFGAHLDSWHSGTGAGDNADGVAVMMEASRILKTLELPMRRTVRIALWGGHEDEEVMVMLGSHSYIGKHLMEIAEDGTWTTPKPEHAKVSAYYNLDYTSGRIRGVYLWGNEKVAPIFARWMEPFHYLGMTTLSPRDIGGSDHRRFHQAGIPSFQFIQDLITWWASHSNMDTYEALIEEDLQQSAAIIASFVYHTANREELLPRIQSSK